MIDRLKTYFNKTWFRLLLCIIAIFVVVPYFCNAILTIYYLSPIIDTIAEFDFYNPTHVIYHNAGIGAILIIWESLNIFSCIVKFINYKKN